MPHSTIGDRPLTVRSPVSVLSPTWLVPIYIAIITIGYFIFYSGSATITGNELSRQRALFASVNAATLSGFTQSTNVNDYTPLGQATSGALILAGTLFCLIAGGTAVCRITGSPYCDSDVAVASVVAVAASIAIGWCALAGNGRGPVGGAFDGLSAFGNCGLYLGDLPGGESARAHLVILPLAILGSLGMPVLMEIAGWFRHRTIGSRNTRTVLSWGALIYLLGTLVLLGLNEPGIKGSAAQWRQALVNASMLSINSRSVGFPFSFATDWSRDTQWFVMLLMFIGGASGGTAGGLKIATAGVLARGAWGGSQEGRIASPVLGTAVRWLLIFGCMVGVGLLALLWSEPQMPADRVLFLVVSALGNVGLSHDPVVMSDSGWWIMSAIMLTGRIAPVLMLWWMADHFSGADVAIG